MEKLKSFFFLLLASQFSHFILIHPSAATKDTETVLENKPSLSLFISSTAILWLIEDEFFALFYFLAVPVWKDTAYHFSRSLNLLSGLPLVRLLIFVMPLQQQSFFY